MRTGNRAVTAVITAAMIAASLPASVFAMDSADIQDEIFEISQVKEDTAVIPSEAENTETLEDTGYFETDVSGLVLQEGGLSASAALWQSDEDAGLSTQAASDYSDETLSAVEDRVVSAWENKASQIYLYDLQITADDYSDIYSYIMNRHPEMFYVEGSVGASISGGYIYNINARYKAAYTDQDIADFRSKTDSIMSLMNDEWSDVEKALFLHDYIVTHVQYDLTYQDRNAYEALVNGSGVCQGYVLAYSYLLDCCGIENDIITSDSENHAWNLVSINGKHYYVDCTGDDPLSGGGHMYGMYARHTEFLKSQEAIETSTNHQSTDWENRAGEPVYGVYTDNKEYDSFFWTDADSPIPYIDGVWGYFSKDETYKGSVHTYDFRTGTDSRLAELTLNWPVWETPGANWGNGFASMAGCYDRFYISDANAVFSITADGTVERFYELTDEELSTGYIYGISAEGGMLTYYLATGYQDTEVTGQGTLLIQEPPHVHEMTHVPASAPTVTGYGNTEYWSCGTCGRYFADADGVSEIAEGSWVLEPLPAKPTIITQPQDASPVSGGNVAFTVEATGAAAYQWQYSKDGVKWFKSSASGNATDTVTIASKASNYLNLYRCRLTGNDGSYLYTDSAGFKDILKITRQPVNAVASVGQKAVFTVAADNAADGGYQWQYSKDGIKWYKSSASGAAGTELTITVSASNKDNYYRCKIKGRDGTTQYTEYAVVEAPKSAEIIRQPHTGYADVGNKVTFKVKAGFVADGGYQWQYSKDGSKWYKSTAEGAASDTVSFTVTNANKTNLYRCRLIGEDGRSVFTDSAGIEITEGLAIIIHPVQASASLDDEAEFSVIAANVAEDGYQWQYSKDGVKWYKSSAEGAQTDTMSIVVKSNNSTNVYRCKITGTDGKKLYSGSAGIDLK